MSRCFLLAWRDRLENISVPYVPQEQATAASAALFQWRGYLSLPKRTGWHSDFRVSDRDDWPRKLCISNSPEAEGTDALDVQAEVLGISKRRQKHRASSSARTRNQRRSRDEPPDI